MRSSAGVQLPDRVMPFSQRLGLNVDDPTCGNIRVDSVYITHVLSDNCIIARTGQSIRLDNAYITVFASKRQL